MDIGIQFCENCADDLPTTCFLNENAKLCNDCEAQPKCKCPGCKIFHPESAFVNSKGKNVKNCTVCREKRNAKIRFYESRKKDAAIRLAINTTMRVCANCITAKEITEFHLKTNGKTNKTCTACLNVAKVQNKASKKRLMESDPERLLEMHRKQQKTHRDKNSQTEEWKKYKVDASAKWAKKNPVKRKIYRNANRLSDNNMWWSYKSRAKTKNVVFELMQYQTTAMFDSLCFYCGKTDPRGRGGIDRVDNRKGYTLENCVPCCAICNNMKHEWDCESFIAYAGHIAAVHGFAGKLSFERLPVSKRAKYNDYKTNSSKRGYEFALDESQFNAIVSGDCYLCGVSNSNGGSNGIDRVDNAVGYKSENCKPCCAKCNKLKYTYELGNFLQQCAAIYECSSKKVNAGQGIFFKTKREKIKQSL